MSRAPARAPRPDGGQAGVTLALPALAESVPAARRFVTKALTDMDAAGASDDVAALVSELATNVVIHARTPYTVSVSRAGDTVRVGVRDLSRAVPRRRAYGVDSTTGRGLRLIATMASDWGIDADSGGKAIWFEVRRDNDRSPREWYADVDVDALLSGFGDLERAPLPGSVVTE